MQFPTLKAAALAGAIAMIGAGASLAQPAPAPAGPPAAQRMDPAERAEHHAQRLRDVLQLTPKQEPALRAFIDATKPQGDWREKRHGRRAEMANLTTPERLDRMKARMAERQAAFDRKAEATKRFYAQLSPSQQKAFDALRPMGGRDHGKGGGRHGGGMKGHGGWGGDHGRGGPGEPG